MFSILGGKEIGDGCGIDAGNLSPLKRRDGSALVTFIPFGPGASVENPGCGVIQCGLEIIVGEMLPENFNILVRCICHLVRPRLDSRLHGELSDFTPVGGLPNSFCIKTGSFGRSRFDIRTSLRN
jgi:hypothetical protein